jgi:hypothetical protein
MNVVTLYIFNNATTGTQKKGDRAKVWLQEIYRHTTSTHKKQAHTFVPQQYKFTSNSCGYKTKLANQHGAQTEKGFKITMCYVPLTELPASVAISTTHH